MVNIVNVGYDSTNYYLIETDQAHLLVDIGFPGTLPKLRHSLKRAGSALAAIDYLLVTHYHPDHAGLAQELVQRGVRLILPDVQVAAIPKLKGYLKPDSGYVEIRLEQAVRITTAGSRAFLAGLGLAGEIIATPGHSDDHISLILDSGAAFTGDLPPEAWSAGLAPEIATSWQKIRCFPVRMIYPGHGPIRPLPQEQAGEPWSE